MFYRDTNEALLEMYFFEEVKKLFKAKFKAQRAIMLKPSTIKETWYGFDQGWVVTEYEHKSILKGIQDAIQKKHTAVDGIFVAYFLQFKAVESMHKISRYAPQNITAPYYRSELSVQPNENTGLSQHQSLCRLQNIANCDAFYACGMIFDAEEIWADADINNLRLVPLSGCPGEYTDGERHFIVFQDKHSAPMWCSEPIRGRALNPSQWLSMEGQDGRAYYQVMNRQELPGYLSRLSEGSRRELNQWLPSQLTLLYLEKEGRRNGG